MQSYQKQETNVSIPVNKAENKAQLPIDKQQAHQFIELLTGDSKSRNHFTALRKTDDKKTESRVLYGTIESLWSQLLKLNYQGFNIFVAVNECGIKRTKKTVTKIRAFFYDNDTQIPVNPLLPPSFRVISGGGDHGYWLPSDILPVAEFEEIQSAIAEQLKTDPSVVDSSRLMRIPGFAHVKDPSKPKAVFLSDITGKKYSVAEIKSTFLTVKNKKTPIQETVTAFSNAEARKKLANLVKKASVEEGAANPNGGRNQTAVPLVREGFALGLPKALVFAEMLEYCRVSGLSETEMGEMIDRHDIQHKETPFELFFTKDDVKKLPTAVMADMFLNHEGLEQNFVRYWRGEFYLYDGTKYQLLKLTDLKPKIISFFNNTPSLKEKYRASWADDIITHLTGTGHLPYSIVSGADIDEPHIHKHLIFLKNCVLQLNPSEKWSVSKLSHNPRYFSQVALPFDYDPLAKSPLFLKTLSEILPDQDARDFLQEWFGYNLIHDTSHGKFLVLLGDGANGKSVILTVLTALIGDANVSAIPLENFTAARTFPMAATMGKLANIVDEMGQPRGVESTLKQFVSGSMMNVERKGKDGVEHKPSARLTFATNELPSFRDRSSGLWRRMIILPMTVQFNDEAKQNKNLSSLAFWQHSEELKGILNWAIEGLRRLMARGHFVEPEKAIDFKNDFRREADHVSTFIEQRLTVDPKGRVGASQLYSEYAFYCRELGISVVTEAAFAYAIRKAFPVAEKSKNVVTIGAGKKRERIWTGIVLDSNGGAL